MNAPVLAARERQVRIETALRVAIHALSYGHHAICGGQPGNLFSVALGDIEAMTGLMPGEPGPRPSLSDAARLLEIERRLSDG